MGARASARNLASRPTPRYRSRTRARTASGSPQQQVGLRGPAAVDMIACAMRFVILLLLVLPVLPQERNYARSMVISDRGIVATSQTLASQAAAQILARGGSAVDAAIAANATLAVVEPMMCGLGGDLFAIYWDAKTGKLTGLNASGW